MSPLSRAVRLAVFASLVCAIGAGVGCQEGLDWERDSYDRGTLGEELHRIWKKDAARAPENAEGKVELLESRRDSFVRAVDTVAPPSKLEAVDELLRKTNQPVQNGLLPDLTRKLHVSLVEAADDDALLRNLASDSHLATESFRSSDIAPTLPRRVLDGEKPRATFLTLSTSLLAADGFRPDGSAAPEESDEFIELQWLLTKGLRNVGGSDDAAGLLALRDILVREDQRFDTKRDVSLPVVRFDKRGYPAVRDQTPNDETYRPIFPFEDGNGDGLADIDDEGRFVLRRQTNRRIPAFDDTGGANFGRDALSRAKTGDGLVFEYVDLADTGLHFLVRQSGKLHDQRALWDLLDGLPAALGPRTEHSDKLGTYRGWKPSGPLTDLATSAAATLNFETLPPTLRSLADFIDGHDEEIAHLLHALGNAKKTIDNVPDAELSEDSTIGYDLLPVLEEVAANPELWSDVMDALREPVVAKTGRAMETLLEYRGRQVLPEPNGDYEACFQECKSKFEKQATNEHPHGIGLVGRFECIQNKCADKLFEKKTDFDAPESPDNRSTHQQLFHLLRDTAGTPYAMSIEKASIGGIDISSLPPLIKLPGSAEAFVRSIAGNLKIKNYVAEEFTNDSTLGDILSFLGIGSGDLADLLSTMSGLFGAHLDPEPTPDQITRLFNQPDLKFKNSGVEIDVTDPVCKDGYVMANHHADKLFASEAAGLIDAVQPLAKAFSDHDREELFTRLFVIIHEHYSSEETLYERKDGTPSPMKGANLVSFEPALIEIARSGALFRALHEFAIAVDRAKPITGEPFDERLRQLVYHATRTDEPVSGPNDETSLTLPDSDTVDQPSRMHFLLDSMGRFADHLQQSPEQQEKLESAVETFNEIALETRAVSDGGAEFVTPGTMGLLAYATRELAVSAETWRKDGTLSKKLSEDVPAGVESALRSRTFSTLVRFGRKISADPEDRKASNRLFDEFLASKKGRDDIAVQLYELLVAGVNADRWSAAAERLASYIVPARTWKAPEGNGWQIDRKELPLLSHALELAVDLVERDEAGTGLALLRRGSEPLDSGQTSLEVIGEVISDYYRHNPASSEPYSGTDYRRVFDKLGAWLADDTHGLEQLYDILQRRAVSQ